MSIKLLQDLCLVIIVSNLYYQYEKCMKYSLKIPSQLTDKIYKYYSAYNEYFCEKDLNFFRNQISLLKNLCPLGIKFKFIKDFNFLHNHHLENLEILNSHFLFIENQKLNVKVDNLIINFQHFDNKLKIKENFINILNCKSIKVKGFNVNDGILVILSNIFKNSNEYLQKISINILLENEELKELLEYFRNKKHLKAIAFFKLLNCSEEKQMEEKCQTFIVLNLLKNSADSVESIKFRCCFCFCHGIDFIKNFTRLKSVHLHLNSFGVNKYAQSRFLDLLSREKCKTLLKIQFKITYSKEISGVLHNFFINCENLQDVSILTESRSNCLEHQIYKSFKNSAKYLNTVKLDTNMEKSFPMYKAFLTCCYSLTEINIGEKLLNGSSLSEIFQNSKGSIKSVILEEINNNILFTENISNFIEFIKSLNNLQNLQINFHARIIEKLLENLDYLGEKIIFLSLINFPLNDKNFFSFGRIISSFKRMRELELLKLKIRINESFLLRLVLMENFLEKLVHLDLIEYPIHSEYFIRKILEKSYKLRKFCLNGRKSTKNDLTIILNGLKLSSSSLSLVELSVQQVNFDYEFLTQLSSVLKLCPSLKYLNIDKNFIVQNEFWKNETDFQIKYI